MLQMLDMGKFIQKKREKYLNVDHSLEQKWTKEGPYENPFCA